MEVGSESERVSDQLLIAEIHRRNKQVFESVYKKYYRNLYLLSYQYVSNHEIAEETVHDVFMQIWRRPEMIVIKSSFGSYLNRSVINASLNYLKKERSVAGKLEDYTYSWLQDGEAGQNEEEREQLYLRLSKALEQLPPQCKKVMMLSRFEKLKQQQIADELGISIKTVKNHLTYGFNKMRSILYT